MQTAWFISNVPLPLKIGIAGLSAIAVFRPAWALLIWAGLAPLSTSIAGLVDMPTLGAQLLEAMTVAVITGVVVRYTTGAPTRLALPAIWMSVVAIASGLSEVPGRLMTTTQDHVSYLGVARLLFQHAVERLQSLEPWYFGLIIAEGAALAWAAEYLTRRDTDLAPRVVWCALVGHAGVAVLNITRVIGASLRGGEFPSSLPGLLLHVREYTQYDVNAAASILVMVILAAAGLATRRARLPLILTVGLVTIALWVAGSRVAMAALLITLTGVLALRARRSSRTIWIAGATVLVSAGVIGWLVIGYPAGRNLNLPTSIASRAILFKAALGMTADAPILGIGAGTFLEESSNYGTEALAPLLYDARTRDNAHNYFLQTLAEQGVMGLLALLAMLAAALVPALRATPRRDVLMTWLAAGIVASILTWMTGHPLLLTEAALMFWLFVGVLAGLSEPQPAGATLRRIAGVAAIVMLASIPFRGAAGERAANLEHRASGTSPWQPAVDGERYRVAGTEFSLFLPSRTIIVLPIRSVTESAVTVELRIGSRPIDAVVAPTGTWRQFRIHVPESDSRYVKVDFRLINSPPACQACVWVGKAMPLAR
jgi:hypothetical protein